MGHPGCRGRLGARDETRLAGCAPPFKRFDSGNENPHSSMIMQSVLLVFLAGGVGSALRYGTVDIAVRLLGPAYPWGTLAVNLIGCTVMGIFARVLPLPLDAPPHIRLLLMTGLLGGYTTFSAFSLDAANLWMRHEHGAAVGYVVASVIGGLICVALGLLAGRALAP